SGEGTPKGYPHPLVGDRSLNQLAAYIAKSMPEDKPGTCVGDDAKNVASYVYDSFYSPAARARNRPARVELSRLTVNQYANVVADLLGSFQDREPRDGEPGLRGNYVTRHRIKDRTKRGPSVSQTDAVIDFDFGKDGPLGGRIEPEEYQI